jgi:hypothetical protein
LITLLFSADKRVYSFSCQKTAVSLVLRMNGTLWLGFDRALNPCRSTFYSSHQIEFWYWL